MEKDDFKQSVGRINEVLDRIPTLRVGLVRIPFVVIISLLMILLVVVYTNPPFFPLMCLFGLWCTAALGTLVGFAVYYVVGFLPRSSRCSCSMIPHYYQYSSSSNENSIWLSLKKICVTSIKACDLLFSFKIAKQYVHFPMQDSASR